MEGVAWTAITLLGAAVFGMLFYLGGRIESLGNKIDARGAELGGRIDGLRVELGGRIDAMTGRVDALSLRMDEHITRHAG